jgi:hypothetical protein
VSTDAVSSAFAGTAAVDTTTAGSAGIAAAVTTAAVAATTGTAAIGIATAVKDAVSHVVFIEKYHMRIIKIITLV